MFSARLGPKSTSSLLTSMVVGSFALACVSPPPPTDSLDSTVVEAAENEGVRIDNVVILLDSSGSMKPNSTWGSTQNLAGSFVAGMPKGEYRAAVITFGGDENQISDLAAFDRDAVDTAVYDNDLLGKSSDIAKAIDAAARQLAGREGNNAVVLFSDGVASLYGRDIGAATTIAAAEQLASTGNVCFYAIQSGDHPKGSLLMKELVAVTPCGRHANATDLTTEDELHDFQREMFIEEITPPVAVFVDEDADGVEDSSDQCLNTPKMARVNEFGCWVLDSYAFDTNESKIVEAQYGQLDEVAKVLQMNPDLRVRIDGHTDSTGPAKFNQELSERRALAVRTYLEGVGIDPSRLETNGFGMTAPVGSNDTTEGMAQNRRCEITILDVTH
jgi:hypothetical protein